MMRESSQLALVTVFIQAIPQMCKVHVHHGNGGWPLWLGLGTWEGGRECICRSLLVGLVSCKAAAAYGHRDHT